MTVEISFIDNAKPPYWYGCTFVVHKGTPLLIECRYMAGKADLPIGGNKPPQHVYTHIITYLAKKADQYGIALMEYPELDKKREPSLRAKKQGLSSVDIANAALTKLGREDLNHYKTGLSRMKNIIPLYGEPPSVKPLRDAAELQQMIEKMIAAGFFFPQPPSKPEDGKA